MATDPLTQLDQALRSFLLGTYTAAVGADSAEGAFVALQPGGLPLSDELFRIRPDDPGYSASKATEEISRKTDLIGLVDGGTFRPVLLSVSEVARMAARSSAAPAAGSEGAVFLEALRADANRALAHSELTSYRGLLPYLPAFASPDSWYDATRQSAWTSASFSAGDTTTTTVDQPVEPGSPPRWRFVVAALDQRAIVAEPGRFHALARVVQDRRLAAGPDDDLARLVQVPPEVRGRTVLSELAPRAREVLAAPEVAAVQGGVAPSARVGSATVVPPSAVARGVVGRLAVAHPVGVGRLAEAVASRVGGAAIEPRDGAVPAAPPALHLEAVTAAYDGLVRDGAVQDVETSSLSLGLEYTLVTLARDWFPDPLVLNPNWYLPGYRAGQLVSAPSATSRPAVPVAFVAVRRVRLAGRWSSRDTEVLPAAVSIGPLSLVGRTITTEDASVTVEAPGMQIVAWICQPLPDLPPMGDAALG